MGILINSFRSSKILDYLSTKLIGFPKKEKNYNNFFNRYAKQNYKWIKNPCLCRQKSEDFLISEIDRHYVNFPVVLCKACGLVRAEKYLRNKDVNHFYKYIYRTKLYSGSTHTASPNNLFKKQLRSTRHAHEIISKYQNNKKKLKIVDVGGGVGGILEHFDKHNELYLCDFYKPYLNFAKKKSFNVIEGGINKINFKPDIIILSHVIEHCNNFDIEIKRLIKIQKKNCTLNYIEFPGIDSLQKGRRQGDILGDIHVPHVYYFQTKVFENLMNRYGFKKINMNSFIRGVFIYTGKKKKIKNYYKTVCNDIVNAEKFRIKQIFINFLKIFIPTVFIKQIRKIKDNSIEY